MASRAEFKYFLGLPVEIRREIYSYELWPSIVQVQLLNPMGHAGNRSTNHPHRRYETYNSFDILAPYDPMSYRVLLQQFEESSNSLNVKPVRFSKFMINKQIYMELCDLLYDSTIWELCVPTHIVEILQCIPSQVESRVHHIAFRLEDPADVCWDMEKRKAREITLSTIVAQLKGMASLRRLHIHTDLGSCENMLREHGWWRLYNPRHLRQYVFFRLAALTVARFTWNGLETSLPFPHRDLPTSFTEMLSEFCGGGQNVRWVSKGSRRYLGEVGELVVTSRELFDDDRDQRLQELRRQEIANICNAMLAS